MILLQSPAAPPRRSDRLLRLAQVYDRDPEAEGQFWYSVVTTGVYCRPACPSRRARPDNIRLHDTLLEARATGFRPCGRCRPEQPALHEQHRAVIDQACRLITASRQPVSSRSLAAELGLSPSYFHRLFRRVTGTTPCAYARTGAKTPGLGETVLPRHAGPNR